MPRKPSSASPPDDGRQGTVHARRARCDRDTAALLAKAGTSALIIFNEEPVDYGLTVLTRQAELGAHAAQYFLDRGHRHLVATLVPTYDELSRPRTECLVAAATR